MATHMGTPSMSLRHGFRCVTEATVTVDEFLVTVGEKPRNSGFLSTVSGQLKSHPALVPLFIFIGGGMVMSGAYLLRLAMGPHVSWNRNGNPEPCNKTEPTQQHKFYSVNMDYSKLKNTLINFD
ncbi:cytochrome c oxidase subunit NDUFA4-like [Salvelinus namaycush]|uniref:Cytochrome c oxidase subunit NDUFA4 n=1 Tax=Salvelinus namaycush TaxID=8040 RepID=A0A8U1BM10_SALNM|nr:cytochrome c oxidase subunit NDUFA4-like [Salvelinus namaycush]